MASCGDFPSHCTHWSRHHGSWSFSFQRSERQTQHFGPPQSRHHNSVACLDRALRMKSPFPTSEPAGRQCSRFCWWHEGNSCHSFRARRIANLQFSYYMLCYSLFPSSVSECYAASSQSSLLRKASILQAVPLDSELDSVSYQNSSLCWHWLCRPCNAYTET